MNAVFVSMDSTLRSNLFRGDALDLTVIEKDALTFRDPAADRAGRSPLRRHLPELVEGDPQGASRNCRTTSSARP